MGAPFSDITIYAGTKHKVGTPGYYEDVALVNYVSDLYVQKMYGYKLPKASRITIQPAYFKIWNRSHKNGSIISIAPFFNHDEYKLLDKNGRYLCILDLIQVAVIQLSDEYDWDKSVFERAYKEVLECNFNFQVIYPPKKSRDRKKAAKLIIEKTHTVSSMYVEIEKESTIIKVKLFDKKNWWWYDSIYYLSRSGKWFDTDRFGISFGKGKFDIWYSVERKEVSFYEKDVQVEKIDFGNYFMLG